MTFGRWILGVALLAIIVTALAVGARAVRRRFVPELDGPTALLGDAILTISALVVLAEALGVVGLFEAAPLVVGAVALGVGGVAVGRRGAAAASGAAGARGAPQEGGAGAASGAAAAGRGALLWISVAGAASVFAAWVRRTLVSLDFGVGGVDSLWYHLPFAARFAQEGSVTAVPYVDLEFLTAFYPANIELLHGAGFVLFGTAALAPLLSLAFLALGLLAGWCAGRPFGAAPATLLATALAFGVPAMVDTQAGEAKNDVAALAFLLAAAALLLATKPRPATLALAGAAAGLALGTKLSLLAPFAALLAVAVWIGRRHAVAFAAAAGVTGGFWYLRNLLATGNPLPWLGPLPQPAEARSEATATALADYLFDGDAWSTHFLPALDDVLGPAWPVAAALAAAGIVVALVRGPRVLRALAVVAIVAAVAYVVTPSSAAGPEGRPVGFGLNVRYVLPAVLLGLCLLPLALRRASGAAGVAVLAVLLAITQLVPDTIWAFEHRRKALALLVIGLLGAAVVSRMRRPTLALVALAAIGVAALWPLERDFLRQQYTATLSPYTSWKAFGMTPVYAWAETQRGARIAVTGTTGGFFQFPLHGRELQNEVRLLGDHGPRGSFTPLRGCGPLRSALQGHTHVVVTPHLDIWDPYRPLAAPELACIRMTGAREVLTSGAIHVFELRRR